VPLNGRFRILPVGILSHHLRAIDMAATLSQKTLLLRFHRYDTTPNIPKQGSDGFGSVQRTPMKNPAASSGVFTFREERIHLIIE
jgi:hypothetical protein